MRKKVYSAAEMAQLYSELPNTWLLLEVLQYDDSGRANKLRLIRSSKNKEVLYDYLMEIQDWDWNNHYIFVYSDPDITCEF